MKILFKSVVVAATVALFSSNIHAGFFDDLKSAALTTNRTGAAISNLSEDQVVAGLKEALSKGVTNAVSSLGHPGGFLTNLNVRIPMPGKLQTVEKALRLAGQNQLADDFVASMNQAAEQAVPVAASVFGDSIKQMSIADAKQILSGPDDAATQYFRKTTQTNLFALFHPIVRRSTDKVGVTAKYKQMMEKFASVNSLGSVFGSISPVKLDEMDIDSYVTSKSLDGLFKMVADEEKSIRANPLARTTDLLKSVFGTTK